MLLVFLQMPRLLLLMRLLLLLLVLLVLLSMHLNMLNKLMIHILEHPVQVRQ
jgi:hypothetical protein